MVSQGAEYGSCGVSSLGIQKLDTFLTKHEYPEIILNVTKDMKNPLFSFSQNYI